MWSKQGSSESRIRTLEAENERNLKIYHSKSISAEMVMNESLEKLPPTYLSRKHLSCPL